MGTTAYEERDYNFGQAILDLRTKIGLTQVGLANELGISRHAVGEWETGSSYPKALHLKALIALAVQERAFTAGREAEEIRALWEAACQKVLLDERWLSSLLLQQRSSHLHLVSQAAEESTTLGTCRNCGLSLSTCVCSPAQSLPASEPRVDWGEALALPPFYGREEELALLSQWIVQERCRVVSILGMGGVGKSVLAVSTMYEQAEHFEVVIFRSLRDAPSCEALLDDCLQVLSPQVLSTLPTSLDQRMRLLLSLFRTQRVLVVLDNLESLLEEGNVRGHFRPELEGYGQLLRLVGETDHQSCLLLTSREKPSMLRTLASKTSTVRWLRLAGLSTVACKQILEGKGVISGFTPEVGTQEDVESLIEVYAGNPLALKIVAEIIIDLFGGKIGPFLSSGTAVFGSINELLAEHFVRLSMLEQRVLSWLAIMREPVTLEELQALLVTPLPSRQVLLDAVDALRRRSLIERGKRSSSFTLQSIVLEYVTVALTAEGSREIQQGQLDGLIHYGFSQAYAKEYVRQAQERLLLAPLLAGLQNTYRGRGEIEKRLLGLLGELRKQNGDAQGYGPANLVALLRLQRGNLNGLDLSHLYIRGAYLQSVEIRDALLVGAQIRDAVFTEAVNATWTVAISPDGSWWAAGSLQGKVRIWEEGSQTLHLIWQAHTDAVYSLVFSPDGRSLASGSTDGTVKLWDVSSKGAGPCGTLLWTGRQQNIQSLAFSPDGSLLASGGADTTVRLWEMRSHGACPRGTNLQTLAHASHVRTLAFSPDGHLLASGSFDGEIRLWERRPSESCTYVEILSIRASSVADLAFAPDGKTLASAHLDRMVRLWEVKSLRLLHTLLELQAMRIAWSPDGKVLASYCEKTIWLWDVEQGRCRAVLHGHSANVYSLTFAPNGSLLLSGSADGTLRVWNVESCQCVRVIAGYGVILFNLDWSPDGTQLVSGGSDALVTIWDVAGEAPPRALHGHTWVVYGVGWSPDGRSVASCGWDMTMRLWDATLGICVQRFEDSSALLLCMAWSSDGGLLACGTNQRGVQVWDVRERSLRWVGEPYQTVFIGIAWSPDGTRLASAGNDGSAYLWESVNGALLHQLSGHDGWVTSVGWSPDGAWLASGSRGRGELFIWDVMTGERVQTFVEHPSEIYALVWSPREDELITGGGDGILRWWHVKTGECVSMREAHKGPIRALRVSPDGKQLASCGNDGAIMIWNLESGEHLRTLRRDRPYERLNITGIRGLNEAQKASLQALGAIERDSLDTKP